MLIVTFYSNPFEERVGFQLSYFVDSMSSGLPFPSSVIISESLEYPSSSQVAYPTNSDVYQNNDLATFIYTPNYSLRFNSILYGLVRDVSLESSCGCCDAIYIYEFSASSAQWEPHPQQRL